MAQPHPFQQQWNPNTRHYPKVAELLAGHRLVLDAGCGDGTLARHLVGLGHEVVGLDRDPEVLPPDSPGAHFLLGDVTNLPFPDDSFDAVVSVLVLHHTRMELALVEMRRVLKPGGLFVDLGIAKDGSPADLLRSVADVPDGWFARRGSTAWEPATARADPTLTWSQTRRTIDRMLPDAGWQRLPGRRYLATWRRPA